MAATTYAKMSSLQASTRTMARSSDTKSIQPNTCTSIPNIFPFVWVRSHAKHDRLPGNITYAEGALLEPLSVVMRGLQVAQLQLGRGAVICGAGPIGLIALAAARASGAHPLVVTDVDASRLAFAKEFVPSCTPYQVNTTLDAEGNAKAVRALFGKDEYNAPETVLECTGVETSICTAAYTARRGGNVVVIGVGRSIVNNLPFMHLSLAEVCICLIHLPLLSFHHKVKPETHVTIVIIDRPPLYQPLSRYLAACNLVHEWWNPRPEEIDLTHSAPGEGNGRTESLRRRKNPKHQGFSGG